ncbi:SET domain-containing protein [Aspergillus avenaceus]|uniref:SET domain-containing protein n=1 Tax=Aspergillus avenaceus TaxID=36643 RepID=A0A5N6U7M0_ASPAV|nr:SET domain-containing protein [Aspergillus avenaceus]
MESPGAEHDAFTEWAVANGIEINGVAPARFPGRRLGMIATRPIEEGEIMLTIPQTTMLSIDSVPASFRQKFPASASTHGILAAYLTHGDPEALARMSAWTAVWPSWTELKDSTPILWPEHLRRSNSAFDTSSGPSLLPPSVSGLWNSFGKVPVNVDYETRYQNMLAQEEARLRKSWDQVLAVFPGTEWTAFVYNWLIINSRSFYYVSPGGEEPEDWNDAIAMVPYADYFNHEDNAACEVRYDNIDYTFRSTKRYEQGEEVYMSYGPHSNDFLFTEYGFTLDTNANDAIYLDDIIFQDLTIQDKKELVHHDSFGNYEVTATELSPSILTAACLKYMSKRDFRIYIEGRSKRAYDAGKSVEVIQGWIEVYRKECEETTSILQGMSKESKGWEAERLEVLLSRWGQIKRLCEGGIQLVESLLR